MATACVYTLQVLTNAGIKLSLDCAQPPQQFECLYSKEELHNSCVLTCRLLLLQVQKCVQNKHTSIYTDTLENELIGFFNSTIHLLFLISASVIQ